MRCLAARFRSRLAISRSRSSLAIRHGSDDHRISLYDTFREHSVNLTCSESSHLNLSLFSGFLANSTQDDSNEDSTNPLAQTSSIFSSRLFFPRLSLINHRTFTCIVSRCLLLSSRTRRLSRSCCLHYARIPLHLEQFSSISLRISQVAIKEEERMMQPI